MIIAVSGVPGTGKTTFAKALAKELEFKYIDVKKIIKDNCLYDSYDKKDKCFIVDTKKLNDFLIKDIIKKNKKENISIILDSHLSHYIPKKYIDLCIITKCDLKELNKRLKKRRYSKEKIRDNLDSEIFNICYEEAKTSKHNIFVIITTKGIKKETLSQLRREAERIEPGSRRTK